ncbi:HNH endonuclease [Nocardia tengchongensis]|uniref:HNH endonuclease n=1 Tax=Nocardia tengchongensis TaxID=2055889 RepID=UPI0036675A2C
MAARFPPHPCEQCGATTSNKRFCSNACHLRGTEEQRASSRRRPRPCPNCGTVIRTRGAQSCSRAYADQLRRSPISPCQRCGTIERDRRNLRGPYCSWTCYNEDRYERTGGFARWLKAWLSGEQSGTTLDGKPDHRIRQALVQLRGQACEECGWDRVNPVSKRVPLHVDHITGDRARNRPDELRLLCPNCHSLTTNYQHLNNPEVAPIRKDPGRRYRETWLRSTQP